MKFLRIIFFIVIVSSQDTLLGQVNFNTLSICHSQDRTINCISAEGFILHFSQGILTGFITKDGLVQYSVKDFLFRIKNEKPADKQDSFITLQLTADGPIAKQGDKSIKLDSAGGFFPDRSSENVSNNIITSVYQMINGFVLDLTFKDNSLNQIKFSIADRLFSITISQFSNGYQWSIGSKKFNSESVFILDYSYSHIGLLTIRDNINHVGISLFYKRSENRFHLIEAYEFDPIEGRSKADPEYKIKYDKKGRFKNRKKRSKLIGCNCS